MIAVASVASAAADRGTPFTAPSQVAFQLTLPWTADFTTLDSYADPAAREADDPRHRVSIGDAISAHLVRGGRAQTDVVCQDRKR